MKRRICALCLALASFVTPLITTVGATPHPDHPGHVGGLT